MRCSDDIRQHDICYATLYIFIHAPPQIQKKNPSHSYAQLQSTKGTEELLLYNIVKLVEQNKTKNMTNRKKVEEFARRNKKLMMGSQNATPK